MNILHISSAKSWRGGERQVHFLIDAQSAPENNVYLMCPSRSPLQGKCIASIKKFVSFRNGATGYPINLVSLVKICKAEKIDIIHGHDSHAHTLLWMAYKMGNLEVPSVVTRRLNNPIRDKSKRKYNHPGIKKIICISEAVKEKMSPQIDELNRLAIIHSSIDLSDISEPRQLSTQGENTIGYIAAFTEEKDHLLFVEVALKLLQINSQYRFLLVGDGPLLVQTKEIVVDHSDKFEFTGFVEDVDNQYQKMDILLHTAKSEALGTSILDGMKFGLPIVANDVGGINEIVEHGKNGLLAEGRDALQLIDHVSTILCDSELYHQMSMESLSLIKSFGVSAMVQKTMDVYSEILRM